MTSDQLPPARQSLGEASRDQSVPYAGSETMNAERASPSNFLPIPGFWGAIGLLLAWLAVQLGVAVPWLVAAGVDLSNQEELIEQMTQLSTVLTTIATAVVVLLACGKSTRRALAIRGFGIAQCVVVVLLAPVVLLTNLAAADWTAAQLNLRPEPADVEAEPDADVSEQTSLQRGRMSRMAVGSVLETVESMYGQMADETWPVVIFFFCLLPALGEEPMFRGLLGRGLTARYGGFGILVASFLFAVQHLAPDRIAATFLLGVFAQLVYLATKSLLAPILLHFINNLLALAPDKLESGWGRDVTGLTRLFEHAMPAPLAATSIFATGALLWLLFSMRTRWMRPDGSEWSPGYLTAEMPPAEIGARASTARPAVGVILLALLGCLIFGVAYGWYAIEVPVAETLTP